MPLKKLDAEVKRVTSETSIDIDKVSRHTVTVEMMRSIDGEYDSLTFEIDESEVPVFRERVGKNLTLAIEDT